MKHGQHAKGMPRGPHKMNGQMMKGMPKGGKKKGKQKKGY